MQFNLLVSIHTLFGHFPVIDAGIVGRIRRIDSLENSNIVKNKSGTPPVELVEILGHWLEKATTNAQLKSNLVPRIETFAHYGERRHVVTIHKHEFHNF